MLAGFINLTAVVDYVRRQGAATVAIMPAGNVKRASFHAEDDGCAESMTGCLSNSSTVDLPSVIARCRADGRIVERRANEPDLAADIELCFDLDAVSVVPRVVGAADQRWFSVVAA